MSVWFLVAAAGLLAVNAFFVAAEFALVAARVPRLEAGPDNRSGQMALAAVQDLQRQLAGCQLGITVASLGLGYTAEPALARLLESAAHALGADLPPTALHSVSFVAALGVVVFLHMVLGEMVPKNIAISAPERSMRLLAPAMRLYLLALRPVIWGLNSISAGLVRLAGVKPVNAIDTVLSVS